MAAVALTHAGVAAAGISNFSRLFQRSVPALDDRVLRALAWTMRDGGHGDAGSENTPPAGYTYLGQFIDHDLVADLRVFPQPAPPILMSERTPRFDLDSLYGGGPSTDPDLYVGTKLRLNARDLARNEAGIAFVKDRRNDSNLMLSQMHVAFACFHNRIVDEGVDFDRARQIVCRHYQWVVLRDYLPRIVGAGMVQAILGPTGVEAAANLRCVRPGAHATMPLEFSAAAFRLGHSMVRSGYQLQTGGEKLHLFLGDAGAGALPDLRGFRPVPAEHRIQWRLFFEIGGSRPQRARPIDTFIVPALYELPKEIAESAAPFARNLPYRNLYRGEIDLGLPTGQDVVRAMRRAGVPGADADRLGVETPIRIAGTTLAQTNLAQTGIGVRELTEVLNQSAPLWYYVLAEAAQCFGGTQLGPVGGRIVAETFIGLMLCDPTSILNTGWRPSPGRFGCLPDGTFGIVELLSCAVPD